MHQVQQRRRRRYCVTYRWPPSLKKNTFTVSPLPATVLSASPPAAIPWIPSRAVSPIPGTVHLILSRKKMALLCHLYLPQFIKMPGQYRKKFNILPASAASQALQNSGNTSTEIANPLKKIWQTRQLISKKTKSKTKKMMGLQRFLLYKLFLSSKCDRKLENSGKDFKWRGDRKEDGDKGAGRLQQEKQKSGA